LKTALSTRKINKELKAFELETELKLKAVTKENQELKTRLTTGLGVDIENNKLREFTTPSRRG
jgi:hypothetical protein